MANDNFPQPRPNDAVPSSKPTVIRDDALVLDYLINSTGEVVTRTGKVLLTVDEFYLRSGYQIVGLFGDVGVTLNTRRDILLDGSGNGYAHKGSLPYTTTGAELPGDGNWQLVVSADQLLRDDLASEGGAAIVGNAGLIAETASQAAGFVQVTEGDSVTIRDRGYGVFEYVLASGVTPNGFDVIQCTGVPSLALQYKPSDKLSLLAFGAEWGVDSTAAIQRAFESQQEYRIPIWIDPSPSAGFICNGPVNYHGWGLHGGSAESSKITTNYAGTFIVKSQSNDYGPICNLSIFGPGQAAPSTVCFGHAGNGRGWFRTQMKNVRINDFRLAIEVQLSIFCTFDTVFVRSCTRGIFFRGGGAGWNNTWYNNAIVFTNCIIDDCIEYGIDFVGSCLSFSGANTIQNCGDGLRINRDTGNRTNNNTLDNIYFEFNSGKDIDLKDTFVTMGPVLFQNGVVPPTHNIYADNTTIYATGRPLYLDPPAIRIEIVNNSKYIAMYGEIVANSIISDGTSEYVHLPDRVVDKRKVQTITDLGLTPVQLAAPIGTSPRYTNHTIEWMVQSPGGEYVSFNSYGKLASGSFRTIVAGSAVQVSENIFTIELNGITYTFRTVGADGTITVEASAATVGDLIITTRVVNSRTEDLY